MQNIYINLTDRVLDAYSYEHILNYFDEAKKNGITEHGFPRLTANIGILIAHGKRTHLIHVFEQMMDFCCESFTREKVGGQGNDFSVKEIIFCLMEIEKSDVYSKHKTQYWRSLLKQIKVSECYNVYATSRKDNLYNWALFTAVSEFMRGYIGIADTDEFVDIQIATQLRHLDENGMYRDPNEPMVYDLVSRGLFCLLMHFGYKGEYYHQIDECLKKTGRLTLEMQSVSGEIPYGGRSNQFLHNETQIALLFEFEANRYYGCGDLELAGRFKAGAQKAVATIEKWLSRETITHVKNNYPVDSGYGCEKYAYFDKYMVTTASFLYVAYMFCNDTITPKETPTQPAVFSLTDYFHKTFLKNKNWFIEVDTKADNHYDSSGIGRIHRLGAPSAICLSVPGTSTPSYKVDQDKRCDFSLTLGIKDDDKLIFATRDNAKYALKNTKKSKDTVSSCFECDFGNDVYNRKVAQLCCEVNADSVVIGASYDGEVALMLPAFQFDGRTHTKVVADTNVLAIFYDGYVCRYSSTDKIIDSGKVGGNRNGCYCGRRNETGVKLAV